MVMFDKLPMRDVLVERLGWSEEDARAFLDVLEAPVDNLATKEDIAVLRSELDQVKAELHTVRTDGDELKVDVKEIKEDVSEIKTDFALMQNDMAQMRKENQEERAERKAAEERLRQYIDARMDEYEKRQQAQNAALFASFSDMFSKHQLRTYMLIGGVAGTLGGMMIAILV